MKNPYRQGTCGHCGKRTEVKYDLTERGDVQYWHPRGGAITICKECDQKGEK